MKKIFLIFSCLLALHGCAGISMLNTLTQSFLSSDQRSFKQQFKDNQIEVTREIDEGLEKLELNMPAIVTCDLRLNEPRYASLPNIMKAKKKTIDQINVEELGIDVTPRNKQIKVIEPPKRQKGIMVNNVAELVYKLKHEAKVI